MRFEFTLPVVAALLGTSLALPTPDTKSLVSRASTSTPPEVTVIKKLGTNLQSILKKASADPVQFLFPQTTALLSNNLATDFETAITSIAALPTSSDPLTTIVDGEGPLVKVVTNSIFFVMKDLYVDSVKVIAPEYPEYITFGTELDKEVFLLVAGLNVKYQGLTYSLADSVGQTTPLGQALKLLGGNTFALLFDGTNGSNLPQPSK